MATYNGRTIVAMPSTPAAQSIEWTVNSIVSAVTSPFTGEQQVSSWGAQYLTLDLTMPPMLYGVGSSWIAFIAACDGMANVFQLPGWLQALVPAGLGVSTYWQMSDNLQRASVNTGSVAGGHTVGVHLIVREVLA